MTTFRLIVSSLLYYWRTNLAVACGVAAGTAVLGGALLVGDSMRGSLRRLVFDRLGRIDAAMVTDRFFRAELADELDAVPAILLRVSLENADPQNPARANRVELVGCDARFWQLGDGRPRNLPQPGEIVLNQPAAERLGAQVGQPVLLRLPSAGPIPADSALGRKQETVRTERLVLSEIIPAEGLGRFGLWPTQQVPLCAFVPLDWLGQRLGQPGGANAILVADDNQGAANSRGPTAPGEKIQPALQPRLTDYGLRADRTPLGYWNITSDRMLLSPATERAVLSALDDTGAIQPALSYLANTLACGGREIPYSTVTALDFANRPPLGPFLSASGKLLPPLGSGEIALNTWAAEQLHAKIGDNVQLRYFEPESAQGRVRETTVSLRLAAIVRIEGAAGDRALVPAVKGMTDVATMAGWNPPFPFDAQRIRPADEAYWDRYGPTPKAFVSLSTGRRLWGSRFGQTTSIRVAETTGPRGLGTSVPSSAGGTGQGNLPTQLQQRLDPAAMGFVFQPVRQQGLEAAAGTTPFGVLFLAFSFFIIAAAVMLVALLFRLAVERRAAQIGTLLALGFSRRQVGRLLLGEGLLVAAAGSLLGLPAGIAYAALMLLGLQSWWLAAITTPFLRLHMTAASLAVGGLGGLAVAAAAIWLSVRGFARLPPRRLLAGQSDMPPKRRFSGRIRWIELLLLLLVLGPAAAMLLGHLGEELKAGTFFAAGALALLALLGLVWLRLRAGMTGPAVAAGRGNLARMALRNAARNPGRSTLTIGLVAAAAFLIVAVSAFRLDPAGQTPALGSGDGGFALVAESDQPVFQNLDTTTGRRELGFSAAEERLLGDGRVFSLRVRAGDDASCLNLYRPRQPRVLGVPPRFVARDGFAWADKPAGTANPWELLDRPSTKPRPVVAPQRWGGSSTATPASGPGATTGRGFMDAPVPVILEKNTANYALGLWGGLGETFTIPDTHGSLIRLQVVALLADSIFQGDLLMGEADFLRCFPEVSGYRFFLIETPSDQTVAVRGALEQALGDYGLAAETTGRRLEGFLAVQNTYLSTFQSLGGLGLLLETFGLAAVQLRNVLERRGELALMRATGFSRSALAQLVLLEHSALLAAGLGIGVLAALLAVLPQMTDRSASFPWASLGATLGAVLVAGLATGSLAVRAVLCAPLLAALREER